MNEDPIVEEVRRAGQALFDRFNNDMVAVCDYLSRRTAEAANAGRPVVSLPPRRPEAPAPPTKKVG
jgi:hypothetical protein